MMSKLTMTCSILLLCFILFATSKSAASTNWINDQEMGKTKKIQMLEAGFLAPMLPAMERKNQASNVKNISNKFLDDFLAAFREETFANANFNEIAEEYVRQIIDPVYIKYIMGWKQLPVFKLQQEINDEMEALEEAKQFWLFDENDWKKLQSILEIKIYTRISLDKITNQKAKLYYVYCLYFQALLNLVDEKGRQLRIEEEEETIKRSQKGTGEYFSKMPEIELFFVDWIQNEIVARMELHFLRELFKWGDEQREQNGIFISRFLIRLTLKPFAQRDQRLQLDNIFGFAQNDPKSAIKLEQSPTELFQKIISGISTMNLKKVVKKIKKEMDELAKMVDNLEGFVTIVRNILESSEQAISTKSTNNDGPQSKLIDFYSDLFNKIAEKFGKDVNVEKILNIKSLSM